MYQPPTPTSFGMVLLEEQDLWPVWVWENDYSLLKKKKWTQCPQFLIETT